MWVSASVCKGLRKIKNNIQHVQLIINKIYDKKLHSLLILDHYYEATRIQYVVGTGSGLSAKVFLTVSDILLLTPKSMSMLSHSVTPMAYRSLKTLAQAIRP